MYRSILVPLDGSTFAEHALPIARSIARRSNVALQLALVHIPVGAKSIDGTVIFDKALDSQLREHERAYLDEVVNRLATDLDVTITPVLIDEPGAVPDILNKHAIATGVDLVVMTTHGRGALARFWLGSVADKFIRQAPMPILLVRPQEGAEVAPDFTREQVFQHVLIPLDGSALSEQILEHAVSLGKLMQANYMLLRVIELTLPINYPPESVAGVDDELIELLQVDAQTYLDGVAERLRAQSLQVQTRIVFNHQPAMAILEEAGQHGINLIAMETHGHGGLARLLMGSVADKVLRGANIPVLLHRPQGETS